MRFLADMGVDQRIVDWLRAQGHDAIHLREQGLFRAADEDIFAKAIAENRIVLTFDLDF
jgi:predicted nuclease of predicted toxin-antitoxin system